jgi:hypothetical protein
MLFHVAGTEFLKYLNEVHVEQNSPCYIPPHVIVKTRIVVKGNFLTFKVQLLINGFCR